MLRVVFYSLLEVIYLSPIFLPLKFTTFPLPFYPNFFLLATYLTKPSFPTVHFFF